MTFEFLFIFLQRSLIAAAMLTNFAAIGLLIASFFVEWIKVSSPGSANLGLYEGGVCIGTVCLSYKLFDQCTSKTTFGHAIAATIIGVLILGFAALFHLYLVSKLLAPLPRGRRTCTTFHCWSTLLL